MSDEIVPVGEQADIITGFIEGLLDALGIDGSVNRTQVDDETIELDVVSETKTGSIGTVNSPSRRSNCLR